MTRPTLICDVDNTILNTRPRVKACLAAIGRPEVFEQSPRTYGGFKEMLSSEEVKRFFRIFLSNEYLHLDEPLPDAAQTLHDWLRRGRLVYLTGRHDAPGDSMREGTLRWMRAHGYPEPDGKIQLLMKPSRLEQDERFKQQALGRLNPFPAGSIGVGDLPYEGTLYASMGLRPILVSAVGLFPDAQLQGSHPSVALAASWKQVAKSLTVAAATPSGRDAPR